MTPDYNKAVIEAVSGDNLELEINFNEDATRDQMIRVNGSSIIKFSDLYAFVWSLADAKQKEEMIPAVIKTVRHLEKIHKVRVTKPIREGEFLNVRCITPVEENTVQAIKGLIERPKGIPIIK